MPVVAVSAFTSGNRHKRVQLLVDVDQDAFASFMSIITQPCTNAIPASVATFITSSELATCNARITVLSVKSQHTAAPTP